MRRHFSLIEIVIVAGLLVLVMGLAAVVFTGVGAEARFNHALNGLSKYVDTMRHRAVTMKRPLRIVYDIPTNTYWAELNPADRDAMDAAAQEKLRLVAQVLPKGVRFERVETGPDLGISEGAVSFDIDVEGMLQSHHIYIRADGWSGRVEVHAVSGLVETVVVQGEVLASDWPQPSFGF